MKKLLFLAVLLSVTMVCVAQTKTMAGINKLGNIVVLEIANDSVNFEACLNGQLVFHIPWKDVVKTENMVMGETTEGKWYLCQMSFSQDLKDLILREATKENWNVNAHEVDKVRKINKDLIEKYK